MNTKKAYDDFYQLLQNGDEIKISYKLFDILENYAKARLKDLVGIDIPLHIYFQEEMLIEKEDIKDYYVPYRVNPYTNEICREEWNMGTRAFYNEKGVFVDFSVTDNYHRRELKGYTKISHLIDFAFTIEHELQHVLQFHNVASGKISYNNFKMVKDIIALSFMQNQQDDLSRYFYNNAHNNLFLELDANKQAENFVGKQIRDRGLGKIEISDRGLKKYDIDGFLKRRIEKAHISPGNVSYIINMLFGFNKSNKTVKICDNPEKIVGLLIDSLVRQNPNLYLKMYPILKSVYNVDGSKKTYYEIGNIISKEPSLLQFYNQVIEEDAILKIQKLEQSMIDKYERAIDLDKKNQILDEGLIEIKKIIENENIDIDNILIYLDKRLEEIDKSNNNKSTSKLIFLLAKQTILQRSMLKSAFVKTATYKEELMQCMKLLTKKCEFDFNDANFKNKLDNLITVLEYDHINKIYSRKGYSKEEIKELITVAKRCQELFNQKGYIISDDDKLASEKSNGVLPGYGNLYQTNYYKNVIAKMKNFEEKALLKNNFELINQIYIETQKSVGITGKDINTGIVVFKNENPIIKRILEENNDIIETLYTIREMEDKSEYLTRLDATIMQCELYKKDKLRNSR